MLSKTTQTFATHDIPLECDVYVDDGYPSDSPVFLFFHSGGLVGGGRDVVPPWLVQVCLQRKWPLVSASYRLLPQAKGTGLLEDAKAAYEFARKLGLQDNEAEGRKVIVGGASAGFLMAALTAHHLEPKPIALLSMTGITTFHHPFFNTSVLLTPEPIPDASMESYITAPVSVGPTEGGGAATFHVDKLSPSGNKNPNYKAPPPPVSTEPAPEWDRGCLYDYYLYNNAFVKLLGDVDPGYDWAKSEEGKTRLDNWPATIIIQGNADYDVDLKVSTYMAESLGEDKVKLFLAEGEGHLFMATNYLEDDTPSMEVVRAAVAGLDTVIA